MTAQEKFEARVKELGLKADYISDDHIGAVLPDGKVVVLVHIKGESDDPFTEFIYPPYDELWKDEKFRQACKENFYGQTDNYEFEAKLAYWLDIHKFDKCPLAPVDLYWVGAKALHWFNYEDDQTAEDIIKKLVEENRLA